MFGQRLIVGDDHLSGHTKKRCLISMTHLANSCVRLHCFEDSCLLPLIDESHVAQCS